MQLQRPFPWRMESAEVRIEGDVVEVWVHNLNIRTPVYPFRAEAMRESIGAGGRRTETVIAPEARVELVRRGIQVYVGPITFFRTVPLPAWRAMEQAELLIAVRETEGATCVTS